MELKPCPFCGGVPYFERMGNHHQSCVVICEECGCTLESNEEGSKCGKQWNSRPCIKKEHRDELWRLVQSAGYADDGRHYAFFQKIIALLDMENSDA